MTPEEKRVALALLSMQGVGEGELAQMPHEQTLSLRQALPQTGVAQELAAPYEHRAFAREQVTENPLGGSVGLASAIPAYTAAKALGFVGSRSPASLEEMKQGYAGIVDGLMQAWNKAPN